MLLAQISDLHIKRPGALAYRRVDTAASLERCVERLNAIEPKLDAVVVTGDLVDLGSPAEYEALRKLLAPLTMPVYLLVGNHDERAALREVFDDHAYLHAGGEFVQYAVDAGPLRLIALDSQLPQQSNGHLCAARLAWLETQLAQARGKPVVLALHHPPFVSGIGHMDRQRLDPESSEQLAAIVGRYTNVERVICGHVHRPIFTGRSLPPYRLRHIKSRSICARTRRPHSAWSRPPSRCINTHPKPASSRIMLMSTKAKALFRSTKRTAR